MKRSLALFFLILLCSQPVFAVKRYLGQFYDGEAKPRSEVAQIWIASHILGTNSKVYIHQIDHLSIRCVSLPSDGMNMKARAMTLGIIRAVEVLPGKHIISLGYSYGNTYSLQDAEVLIDAKAGENYVVDGDVGPRWTVQLKWDATLSSYNPDAKEIGNLKREALESSVSIDGVVQSWEGRKQHLILTLSGSNQTREFKFSFFASIATEIPVDQQERMQRQGKKMFYSGQKIRVLYFPSKPEEVVDFYFPD